MRTRSVSLRMRSRRNHFLGLERALACGPRALSVGRRSRINDVRRRIVIRGRGSLRFVSVPVKMMKMAVIDLGGACARHRRARTGLSRI